MFYPQLKKTRIIHSVCLRDASTYSPFRFESVYGEKNALERKKIPLFSLLLFSSLCFQAAMPHGRSLLQATPTPTEPTGWSSALQSKEPTAGSRQLHKKQLQLDASEKKENKWRSFPDTSQSLRMKHILKAARFISRPASFLSRFTYLFPDHEVAAT